MSIKGKKVLSKEDLEYLRSLYQTMPFTFHNQDVNLYYINKANILNNNNPQWTSIQDKLQGFHGRKCNTTNYFLKYQKGSYASMHMDNPVTVEGTAITLIERSDTLRGGEIITTTKTKQTKSITQHIGQTIYYDTEVEHGVSKVIEGIRIVLVTWFRKDTWQN